MSLRIFAPPSVSRLTTFVKPGFRLHAKCIDTTVVRPSIHFMCPQSRSFVGVKDSRHANMTRDIIKDAADQQMQNRASSTPEERWRERSQRALESVARTPPADTYAGRTVHVKAMGDLATSYRQLEGILKRNKVRATLRMTERHEKPGVKRRRLSSQRWRKLFADEVRKKVQLVMKIRDRGA